MSDSSKPRGIKVWAIVFLIFGILGIWSGIESSLATLFVPEFQELTGLSTTYTLIMVVGGFIGSILLIVSSIGLFRYKSFARYLVIVTSILTIVVNLISMIYTLLNASALLSLFTIIGAIISFAVYGYALYYFNKPVVKSAFS